MAVSARRRLVKITERCLPLSTSNELLLSNILLSNDCSPDMVAVTMLVAATI